MTDFHFDVHILSSKQVVHVSGTIEQMMTASQPHICDIYLQIQENIFRYFASWTEDGYTSVAAAKQKIEREERDLQNGMWTNPYFKNDGNEGIPF